MANHAFEDEQALLKKMGFKRGAYKSDWERGKGDMHLKAPMTLAADVPYFQHKDSYSVSIMVDRNTGKVRLLGDNKLVDPDPKSVAKLVIDSIAEETARDLNEAIEQSIRWEKAVASIRACNGKASDLKNFDREP